MVLGDNGCFDPTNVYHMGAGSALSAAQRIRAGYAGGRFSEACLDGALGPECMLHCKHVASNVLQVVLGAILGSLR